MLPTKSWLIALEVDADPDGPELDAKAVAQTMDAVAAIHPSAQGGRRHAFLVRLETRDPADALVSAVTRFRAAPVRGAALLGARVVGPGGVEQAPPPSSEGSEGSEVGRPRVLGAIACALVGIAALLALVV